MFQHTGVWFLSWQLTALCLSISQGHNVRQWWRGRWRHWSDLSDLTLQLCSPRPHLILISILHAPEMSKILIIPYSNPTGTIQVSTTNPSLRVCCIGVYTHLNILLARNLFADKDVQATRWADFGCLQDEVKNSNVQVRISYLRETTTCRRHFSVSALRLRILKYLRKKVGSTLEGWWALLATLVHKVKLIQSDLS